MKTKEQLRIHYKRVRKEIKTERRQEAEANAIVYLKGELEKYKHVLSYENLGDELELRQINHMLCKQNKLILPRVEGELLLLYRVEKEEELIKGKYGNLEPNPKLCKLIDPKNVELALIPALSIDTKGNRLGYGLGYYDRLLEHMPHAETICPIFKEQISQVPLIIDKHDQPINVVRSF